MAAKSNSTTGKPAEYRYVPGGLDVPVVDAPNNTRYPRKLKRSEFLGIFSDVLGFLPVEDLGSQQT